MKNISLIALAAAAALCLQSNMAFADEPAPAPNSPWSFSGSYVGDYLTNVDGGISQAGGHISNISFQVAFDGNQGRIKGLRGTIGGFYNNGGGFAGRRVGDLHGISNIEAGAKGFYLYETWLSLNFGREIDGEGAAMIKAGVLDLNANFDVAGVSGIFMNSSHGIVPTFAQTGSNGPSIFPVLGLAVMGQYRVNRSLAFRGAAFDAAVGDPNNPLHTDLEWRKKDGELWVGEGEYTGENTRLLLGGFRYSKPTTTLLGAPDRRNEGIYAQAEVSANDNLSFFARGGVADDKINIFDKYWATGLTYTGLLSGREKDVFGFAIADGRLGNDGRAFLGGARPNETNYELTYSAAITDSLAIQGDIQYVVNPGADRNLQNATVLGLRIKYEFGSD